MVWFIVMHLSSTLLDWVKIGQLTDLEKDLEILVLRQQLGIAKRKLQKPIRVSRAERLTLAVRAGYITYPPVFTRLNHVDLTAIYRYASAS